MTHRPAYTQHPAYAEWQRLSTTGDVSAFDAAVVKLCEAMGLQRPAAFAFFDGSLLGRPVAPDDSDARHRAPGADPADPRGPLSHSR
jgi:hypothetical protein